MRILKSATIALASIFSTLAVAGGADFVMKNKTGAQIDEIYISQHSSGSWGSDILGNASFGDGESANITFTHDGDVCNFDIKVKYHDGDGATWGDVDLCQYSKITLKWNSDSSTTEAFGE